LNDYQIDRRGDVGSWVREQAMFALKKFIHILYEHDAAHKEKYADIREKIGAH
jgi:hypothetical protein